VAEKQAGANPLYPGPGQYVDPIKEGRAHDGTVKVLLSTQRGTVCTKFIGPSTDLTKGALHRSLAKPNAENEPGPGAYINPMKFGRGGDGQACAVTSQEKGYRSTVWCKKGAPRSNNFGGGDATPGPGQYVDPHKLARPLGGSVKFGRPKSASMALRKPKFVAISRAQYDEPTPGPGQYVNPLKEGRNAEGEVKAVLSTQHNVTSVKFCGPNGTGTGAAGAGLRSLAKPGAEREPGPGQYNGSDRNKDGQPILSKGKSPSSCVFARKAYEPPGADSGNKGGGKANRPVSAPARPRHDLGSGYFKLDGDERVSSKYRNPNQGAKWGPPGR